MDRVTYVLFVGAVSLSATAYIYGIISIWTARIRRRRGK